MGLWNDIRSWATTPFTADPVHVFLITGLVIVGIIIWTRILSFFDAE